MTTSFYKRFINAAVAAEPDAALDVVSGSRCSVDDPGPSGVTALMWAARADDAALVHALLAAGASPERRDDGGGTALLWAARHGAESAIAELLRAGASVDAADALGWTALVWAVIGGHAGAATLLLRAGADVAGWHGCRCAPLPACAREGRVDLVQALLNAGCDVNQADGGGSTALACAAYCGHAPLVRLLLLRPDVNVDSRDSNGDTPLLLAAFGGRAELAAALLRAGADVNCGDADGCTVLCWACRTGNVDLVDVVLRWRPVVDARDRWGRTALMWAAEDGYADIVSRLLSVDGGAEPYARDGQGNTALHLAADTGTLLRLLRAPGPHPRPSDVANSAGETWTALAERRGTLSADCVEELEKATGEYYVSAANVGRALIVCVDAAAVGGVAGAPPASATTVTMTAVQAGCAAEQRDGGDPEASLTTAVVAAGALRMALERLGYLVDVCRNPTARQMDDYVVRFSRKSQAHGSTAIACFLTPSDESQSVLLGADGEALPVASVTSAFGDGSCSASLRGRPKLLLFHSVEKREVPAASTRPSGYRETAALSWHLLVTFSAEPLDGGVQSSYPAVLAEELAAGFGEFEANSLLTAVKAKLTGGRDGAAAAAVETRSTLDKLLILSKPDGEATTVTMDAIDV